METILTTQPKRRGRPPQSVEMINGQQYITAETLEKEIDSLERHRKACRERYRTKRDMLRALRPDLFHNRNGSRTNRQAIRRYGIPLQSNVLQQTQENRDSSDPENGTGLREISLREILNSSTPQIQGQNSSL